MSSNVVVLTPNGRRQTVKVTPNTTILQIIEEVCKKQGFEADEFDVKHHKKILDTTTTYRFSGLPNNAQLELVEAQKSRLDAEVILGVQLEDGRRLLGNFTPSNTLWEVISNLCPTEAELQKNPVVIYMRQEVYGSNLQETTLKKLGLTGGRAMLRLVHRNPEDLKTQANVSAPLPVKPVEEKPYVRQFKPVTPEPSASTPQHHDNHDKHVHKDPRTNDEKPKHSPSPKPSTSSEREKTPPKKVLPPPKATDMLTLIKQERQNQKSGKAGSSCSKTTSVQAKGSTQTCTQSEDRTIEEDFVFLGERNAMVFSLETSQAVPSEDLPDEFFDLTINDAKKLLKDIKRTRFEMENGKLLTSNLRNLEESKKQLRALNRYKRAIIRVQFPDRTVLQGTFIPTDTVGTVMHFISEYLEDRNIDFYVYITPPKTVLSRDSRLIEIGCVPGAILHFGVNSTMATTNKFLKKDLLDKFTSSSMASLAAAKMRQQATNQNVQLLEEEMELDHDVNVGASTSSAPPPVTYEDYDQKPSPSSPPEKVPKWFKPMK